MPKLRQHDVKTFKDLQKFAKPYGYKLNAHGKLRQQPWLGLAFDEDGRVVYLKNGAVICESGMSFENYAILIEIIGDIEKIRFNDFVDNDNTFILNTQKVDTKNSNQPTTAKRLRITYKEVEL
ncbi:MAG: hypothetical protein IJ545_04875 [Alphaproteobacteria bacterium]|nr:hypothetical protein [Alphaproteobacteria bacterium]